MREPTDRSPRRSATQPLPPKPKYLLQPGNKFALPSHSPAHLQPQPTRRRACLPRPQIIYSRPRINATQSSACRSPRLPSSRYAARKLRRKCGPETFPLAVPPTAKSQTGLQEPSWYLKLGYRQGSFPSYVAHCPQPNRRQDRQEPGPQLLAWERGGRDSNLSSPS